MVIGDPIRLTSLFLMFYQQLNGKMRRLSYAQFRLENEDTNYYFRSGVPNLGYMYLQGYICLSEGVHLRLTIDEKMYLSIIWPISKYLYTNQ